MKIFSDYFFNADNIKFAVNAIEKNLAKKEAIIEENFKTGFYENLVSSQYNKLLVEKAVKEPYYFYIYQNDSLLFWNNYEINPSIENDSSAFLNAQLLTVDNNSYISYYKHLGNNSEYKIHFLLPVKHKEYKNSMSIYTYFDANKNIPVEWTLISPQENIKSVVKFQNKPIFSIKQGYTLINNQNNALIRILLTFVMYFMLFWLIHNLGKFLIQNKVNNNSVFIGMLVVVGLIRFFRYKFSGFGADLSNYFLFSPASFATDYFQRSLGDLFINVFIAFWLVKFYLIHVKINYYNFKRSNMKFLLALVLLILVLALQMYCYNLSSNLVLNSSFSVDVGQYNNFNLYVVISLIILALLMSIIFDTTTMLNNLLKVFFYQNYIMRFLSLLASVLIVLFIASIAKINIDMSYVAYLGFVGLLFILLSIKSLNNNISGLSSKIFVWVIFISTFITFHILYFNGLKEQKIRKDFAASLLSNKDVQLEYLLNLNLQSLQSDTVIAKLINDGKNRSNEARNYLVNKFENDYTNRYGLSVYSFNETFQELTNKGNYTREVLDKLFYIGEKSGTNTNISYQDSLGIYICKFQNILVPDSLLRVYLLFEKKDKSTYSVNNNSFEGYEGGYKYAIYQNGVLQKQTLVEEVPYNLVQKYPLGYSFEGKFADKLIYKKNHKKVAIVEFKSVTIKRAIQIFLFVFSFNIILISLYLLLREIFKMIYTRNFNLDFYKKMSFSNRFLLMCYFIILITFIITYYAVKLGNNTNKAYEIEAENLEVSNLISKTISSEIKFMERDSSFVFSNYSNLLNPVLNKLKSEYELPFNLYDSQGHAVYKSHILPFYSNNFYDKINPLIYFVKLKDNINFDRVKENANGLPYYSNYNQIRDSRGNKIFTLQVSFINSITKIKEDNLKLLSSLFNSFALIFFLASILIYFATRYFTASIKDIARKIKRTSLLAQNQKLDWEYQDEIGVLVKEYNQMLEKLEVSAGQLAQNERDSAWREMAKQVAHEIKNPLTPMKLSLQHLQMAIQQNRPNIKDMANNITRNMISQIDNLSEIATDFSQFARLPETKSEPLNINELLAEVVAFLDKEDNTVISIVGSDDLVWLNADKNQLTRLFNNIISNAIQAVPYERQKNIVIKREVLYKIYRITITDNGVGIDDEQVAKIFTPYFTTKSSGTGLGLAMCKEIVTRHNGNIWFSSVKNVGTSFFIDLPLFKVVKSEDDAL